MMQRFLMSRRTMLYSLAGMLMTAMMALYGCGGSSSTDSGSYPVQPTTQVAAEPLKAASGTGIATADDLIRWINSGYLNNAATKAATKSAYSSTSANSPKLVILSVSTPTAYAAGHIPGAQLMSNTEINKTRLEGVAQMTTQTVDGPMLDAVIKRSGIDENTTIVLTVNKGGSFLNAARAYWTFRYWGFPKERLMILDGGDDAWVDAGQTLTTDLPVVTPSTYSVKNNTNNFNLRASIGEMINLVDNINLGLTNTSDIKILDVRGGTPPSTYVANATIDDYSKYVVAVTGKTSKYMSADKIIERLNGLGVTAATKATYVYCASGTRAASTFFIFDNLLNWPVVLYDGSWGQWSNYYFNTATATNNLPATSPWRVDITTPNTTKSRTAGTLTTTGTAAMTLDPIAVAIYGINDPRANQMKVEDLLYITPAPTTTPTAPTGGGSASGC